MMTGYEYGRAARRRVRMHAGLLAGTMLVSSAVTLAHAQNAPASQASRISVTAGPLTAALNRLAAQTGMQILFDARLAQGKTTNGVQGAATAQQALTQLLAGTGLSARFTGANAATIIVPAEASGGAAAVPEGAIMLDTVNVNGARVAPADTPYQTPGSASYISQEQIERFSTSSSGDLFKSTAGVIAAMNHNGSSIDVNIRGMQGMNRVKVTVDGTQQTTSTWRGYLGVDDRTYVDPDFIAGIAIDKGPSGGVEGAGATGGVVSFRTINAQDIVKPGQSFGGRVRVGTQDNATTSVKVDSFTQRTDPPGIGDLQNGSGSVALATVQENFDLLAAVSKRKSGNYFAGHYGPDMWGAKGGPANRTLSYTKKGEEVFNSSEDTTTAMLKATLRWNEDQSAEFGYTRYESKFGEAIGSILTTGDASFRQLQPAEATVDTYTARYRWKPDNDFFDLKFNVWATDVKSTTASVGPYFYFPPYITPQTYPIARDTRFSETWTYGTDIVNTSKVQSDIGAFKFEYGGSYTLEDTNGTPYISGRAYATDIGVRMNPSVGERTVWSGFSRGEWLPVEWLKLNAGLRYDGFSIKEKGAGYRTSTMFYTYGDKDGGRLNPTASVTLIPVQGLQFFALYAEGYRPPTLRETIGSDSVLAPNPALRPEIAKNKEYGINFLANDIMVADDKARLKISYFDNNYTDYISRVANPVVVGGAAPFTVENLQHAMFRGVEVSGSYDGGLWFGEAAFTYYTDFAFCRTMATCAQASVSNDYALNQLPPKMTNSLTLGTRLIDRKLTLGARVNYAGPRLGPLPISAQQANYWLPYTVVDAFASFKATENITFDVKGENLFDRYYVDALNGWMPSPGRTLRLTLTGTF